MKKYVAESCSCQFPGASWRVRCNTPTCTAPQTLTRQPSLCVMTANQRLHGLKPHSPGPQTCRDAPGWRGGGRRARRRRARQPRWAAPGRLPPASAAAAACSKRRTLTSLLSSRLYTRQLFVHAGSRVTASRTTRLMSTLARLHRLQHQQQPPGSLARTEDQGKQECRDD